MKTDDTFLEQGKILNIPKTTNYWLVRADGGKYFDDFFLNNFIAISNNEVTLEMINTFYQLNTVIGRTVEGYKALLEKTYPDYSTRQVSNAAGRTMDFIERIQMNDIVMVPSKNSQEFLLGVVVGEPYEAKGNLDDTIGGLHYIQSPYLKRRRVQWLKTIKRSFVSWEMRWILSAHQTIFNLNEHADHIDKLISPFYIKENKCYGIISVSTENDINVKQWLNLYNIVNEIGGDDSGDIIIKSNVRSPGLIDFVTDVNNLWKMASLITLLCGVTFGRVKMGNVEMLGIIPYFFNEGKISRNKMKIENENLSLDNELKKIELEVKKRELQKSASDISQDLKISTFNAGKIVQFQKRMDIDNPQNEE